MENQAVVSQEVFFALAQFEEGGRRYNESATFRTVVNALARGATPISIVDSLVKLIDSQNNQLEKLIKISNEEIPDKL